MPAPSDTPKREPGEQQTAVAAGPVLVVDDDEHIRALISETLSDEGYDVAEAPHGAAALELVRQKPPRIILLDMTMPIMDGWQFAAEYRQLPGAKAPIVCVTAAQNVAQRCQDISADAALPKPFDIDDLLAVVERLGGRP